MSRRIYPRMNCGRRRRRGGGNVGRSARAVHISPARPPGIDLDRGAIAEAAVLHWSCRPREGRACICQGALEGDAEQMELWAHMAVESLYASREEAVVLYRLEGQLPQHDLLHLDGQLLTAGRHAPGSEPILGMRAAQQRVHEGVSAEARGQDNYGDCCRVLQQAGLLGPIFPAPTTQHTPD